MNSAGMIDLIPAQLRRQWGESGIYPNQSLYEAFAQRAQQHREKIAVLSPCEQISYGQLYEASLCLASSLQALGIVAGDVVAYQLTNSWRCCAIDLAVAALGAVVAPFPPGRGRLDIESLLKRCDARAIIATPVYGDIDLCEVIESLRPSLLSLRFLVMDTHLDSVTAPNGLNGLHPSASHSRDGWHQLAQLLQATPLKRDQLPQVCPNSPARLLVSSGSEAEPKLVAYSHNALLGGRGRFLQNLHPDGSSFRGMYLVPLGSSFGSTATTGVLAWLGGSIALLPRFDTKAAIEAIASLQPSHILGVPTMLQRMAADPLLQTVDKSSLRAIISGGSVIDAVSMRRCMDAFSCRFISLYGSADGVNCHNLPDDEPSVVFRSVGRPNPDVCAIKIVDDNGCELDVGQAGEIIARGPISPMQYVNAPELDAQYRDAEGWVRTGDLGWLDAAGYLILSGRKKDIIIRGGCNISTVQIEKLVTGHPDVVAAVCIPVPDSDLGQRVCICLTLREDVALLSLAEINSYLREQGLEVNKLPEYLRYYRQLPLSPAGKIDKKSLADELSELHLTAPSTLPNSRQLSHAEPSLLLPA